jgi:hypothetical protein
MVRASSGVAVRKAVVDGIEEHLASLSGFNGTAAAERETVVRFGYDFANRHREHVFTGRSRATTPPAALRAGRNVRNEEGRFDLTVMVRSVGGDPYDAEARAEEIGSEVEDWLAERKGNQLEVDGLQTLVVESWEADYAQTDNGAAALRTYVVRWTARLE